MHALHPGSSLVEGREWWMKGDVIALPRWWIIRSMVKYDNLMREGDGFQGGC